MGINDGTPSANLHIKQYGTGEEGLAIENDGDTDYWSWEIGDNDLNLYFNGAMVGYWDDATGNYNATSDERLKKDIVSINESVIPKVMQLKPVSYRLNHANETSQKTIGFLAQDVQTLFPELVKQDENGYLGLHYEDFGIISIKAIQEQQNQIDELKTENEKLRMELEEIKVLIKGLENK
ncbi:MAG: tail fiber domain-containing protein [Bacteroidota bacterium]